MLRLAPLTFGLISTAMAQSPAWLARPEIQPRFHARAVYDEARQRVVAFGGFTNSNETAETLEWDGHEWIVRAPNNTPRGRSRHGIAYDAARQRTVLFGGAGLSNDTWTWDGHDWTAQTPTQTPPGRAGHALAYDPLRQRVVLFGGSGGGLLNDTWEWDGATWRQASPATRPPSREDHAMAWDPVGRRILMSGGVGLQNTRLSDTWAFDGIDWVRLVTTGPRPSGGMASDPLRQRIVLFDGRGTWEWDGATWTRVVTAHTPSERGGASMAFDARNNRILLGFGTNVRAKSDTWLHDGVDWTLVDTRGEPVLSAVATDPERGRVVMHTSTLYTPHSTWEWDGVRWNAVDSPNAPGGGLSAHSIAFDAIRKRTVLFGGSESTSGGTARYNNVHWEWDGTNWTKVVPTGPVPSPRTGASLVFDGTRNRLLLFGGSDNASVFNDTWEWNGVNWRLLSPVNRPSPRSRALLAHDPQRGVVVMRGNSLGASGDTWEWNGTNWLVKSPANVPPAFSRSSMAYDPSRGRVVVVGNETTAGILQTWEWDGVNWRRAADIPNGNVRVQSAAWDPMQQRLLVVDDSYRTWLFGRGPAAAVLESGAGCAGTEGTPTLSALGLPNLGRPTFGLELGSSRRNTLATLMIGPLAGSTSIGSCTLLVGSGNVHVPLQTGPNGFVEHRLPIPISALLLGVTMSCQGLVLDPAGVLGLFAASGGVLFTVGV